jgi:hypothetical protein
MRAGVHAENLDVSGRRRDQSQRQCDGGGLAGTVRAKEPVNTPARDFDIEAVERRPRTVALRQPYGAKDDVAAMSRICF